MITHSKRKFAINCGARALIASIALASGGVASAIPCDPTDFFEPPAFYEAGSFPLRIAVGDLNGDGFPDLAVTSLGSGSLSVLLNDGDGTFAPDVLYSTGSNQNDIAIGDLDGDGHNDIAVVGNDLRLLLNNGDGTFTLQPETGEGGQAIVIGDVNDDGRLDMVAAITSSNSVAYLRNTGFGVFAGGMFDVGVEPRSVAIGDLNGDGAGDIVSANTGSNDISVLINDREDGFLPAVTYTPTNGAKFVVIVDLDGDGHLDLAVASNNNVSVLLNNGDGTFAADVAYSAGANPGRLAIADIDNNGAPDIITSNSSGSVSVLFNDGDGAFAPGVIYTTANGTSSVATGDLDGDGDPDLATANFSFPAGSGSISVLINQCVTRVLITTQPVPFVLLPAGGGVAEMSVAATGTEPLAYQWRRDGVPLDNGAHVSGATTPTLTVNATSQDIGAYDVVVSNIAGGQAVSSKSALAVRASCIGDANGDGVIDLADLNAVLAAFGQVCP